MNDFKIIIEKHEDGFKDTFGEDSSVPEAFVAETRGYCDDARKC